ncbi:MAG TPA: lysophospholipid acyltransferase family protein [Verrucomicrobiota bacterium]|nr:lysophospholipid acyltransferase family protein [Verrucomicrobiota bacterium]HRT08008.1 lysophospholipid acyltransferase family protein [Candidatus Paceibacterota bacterium]HRT58628.1 lysophospholipid acyltransferase family protein [Candidatus Paceibacterota bacterium]
MATSGTAPTPASTRPAAPPRPPDDPGRMNWLYFLGWCFFRTLFATYFRWRVHNPERVPLSGGVILASNHASFLDPPLVGAGLRRPINYLARKTLFRFPIVGWVLHKWNSVPVDRDGGTASGLRPILERLRAGGAIIMFPEGTRTRDGRLQPARSGIGLAVIKSDAPVVPVRVFGTYEAFGRQARFPRPHRVAVKYGYPLDFQALRAEAKVCSKPRLKEIYQQVADELMAAIARLEPHTDKDRFP